MKTNSILNLNDADYLELGQRVIELLANSAIEFNEAEFAVAGAKPKQCQKGMSCGVSCISKVKTCLVKLQGQAQTFAGWLKMQITAGLKFLKSKIGKKRLPFRRLDLMAAPMIVLMIAPRHPPKKKRPSPLASPLCRHPLKLTGMNRP